MMPEIHPDIVHPTSVQHFLCPDGPRDRDTGQLATTHHMVPRRTGRGTGGFALQQQVCESCGQTMTELRERCGLA